jgi:tetratricopeptide (TPR) repeat protein
MPSTEPDKLFSRGLNALNNKDHLSALVFFEKAFLHENNPTYCSYFAFCLAKERGQYKKAIALCKEAMEMEPDNPVHYLNLGKIHGLLGDKTEALQIFRQGLGHQANPQISAELDKLGARKPPVITFWKRENPLNKYLGFILKKLGLR